MKGHDNQFPFCRFQSRELVLRIGFKQPDRPVFGLEGVVQQTQGVDRPVQRL